jgi:hypothetical protein
MHYADNLFLSRLKVTKGGMFMQASCKKGISTIEDANRFLDETFLPEYNVRFNVDPVSNQDIHKTVPKKILLDEVLCIEDY